jgi:hypothetical protein
MTQLMAHNPAHALDAAMSFSLRVGRCWRGASDVRRWAELRLPYE